MPLKRNRQIFALDALLLSLCPLLAYCLRFEGFHWGVTHSRTALTFVAVSVPLRLAIYFGFGLYRRLWRYASITELELIFVAGATASLVVAICGFSVFPDLGITPARVPVSIIFTDAILSIGIIAFPRLLARVGGWRTAERRLRLGDRRRTLVAGAGAAGQMIVREMRNNPQLGLLPIGFVDDDTGKHGLQLCGLPIYGPLSTIGKVISREDVQELVIAMPSAKGHVVRGIVQAALDTGVKARTMPGLSDILVGRVSVSALREIEIQDLLRREPISINLDQIRTLASDRTVLVTGAGGSIGSELVRQIAQLSPTALVILDHAENPIFHVLNEIRAGYPGLRVIPVIADIRDRRRMHAVIACHKPFAVFHAAAHKHVPLMEENSIEAVTNNVKGTQNLVDAAVAADVEHLVFISTDKAVRPTSVMGATKRVAEHIVRRAALEHNKNYVAVRFGNVLGSQGSVVPTFMQQIRAGGPVTVTHPEMRRFFMTIPEAVQLVLQAGALGRGGELFMLDMGELVKIVDLATDLITLSGLEVGTDIEIQFTGMRPGEKLYEEMFFDHEFAAPTEHPKVLRSREHMGNHEAELIEDLISATMHGIADEKIRSMLKEIVPDFTPDSVDMPTSTPTFPMEVMADTSPSLLGEPVNRIGGGGGVKFVVARGGKG